jgi:hypothetical protein
MLPNPTNEALPSLIEFLASKLSEIRLYFFATLLTLKALCSDMKDNGIAENYEKANLKAMVHFADHLSSAKSLTMLTSTIGYQVLR